MLPFEGIKKNYSVVSFAIPKPQPINLSNVKEQIGFGKQSKKIVDSLKRKVKKKAKQALPTVQTSGQ